MSLEGQPSVRQGSSWGQGCWLLPETPILIQMPRPPPPCVSLSAVGGHSGGGSGLLLLLPTSSSVRTLQRIVWCGFYIFFS